VENNQSFLKTLCLILSTPSYLGGVLIKAGALIAKKSSYPGALIRQVRLFGTALILSFTLEQENLHRTIFLLRTLFLLFSTHASCPAPMYNNLSYILIQ